MRRGGELQRTDGCRAGSGVRAAERHPSRGLARVLAWLLLVGVAGRQGAARAQAADSALGEADRKDQALAHFELGLSHFDHEEWQAALAEFLRSRELFPTRNNTKNAAIGLRKVGRYDAALDLFEVLLRDFPDLPAVDRALANREIADMLASVGTVAIVGAPPGATVTIDQIDRGTTPLATPVRLSAGTHTIRVTLEGTLPFEGRVDLAGRQAAVVAARLTPLTQAGRLRVTSAGRESLRVFVDGASAGSTPWEGALAPGPHVLWSRGEQDLGTAPQQVVVQLERLTSVDLTPASLRARLRLTATPPDARLRVDGVRVGAGVWEGALEVGRHRVEAAAEGYAPSSREITLAEGPSEAIALALRAPTAAPLPLAFEVEASSPLGVWGGDLTGACGATCAAPPAIGGSGLLRVTWSTSSGWGAGLDAGYVELHQLVEGHPQAFTSRGFPERAGVASDSMWLGGIRAGAHVEVRMGIPADLPLVLRIGAGALIGSLKDDRAASGFADSAGGTFDVTAAQQPTAAFLLLAPGAFVRRRLGEHLEFQAGVEVLFLSAVKTPSWTADSPQIVAGPDGAGTFPTARLAGPFMVLAAPTIGLRYAL